MEDKHEELQKSLERHLESVASLLQKMLQTVQNTSPLEKPTRSIDEIKVTIAARFTSITEKINRGLQGVLQAILDMSNSISPDETAQLTHSFSEIAMINGIIELQWHTALDKMSRGEPIATALGISLSGLDGMYKLARALFTHQFYEESAGCFCLLCLLNPAYFIFWMGLGHSEYCLGNFKEANLAYVMASQIKKEDPAPHLSMAHCFRAMKEDPLISPCFALAELACVDDTARNEVRKAILQLKQSWKLT